MSAKAWVLWAAGGSVLVLTGAGAALALRALGPLDPPRATPASADACCDGPAGPARHGTKPPGAFGLPAYPGAFAFHSMEAGAENGSVAFSISRGSARDLSGFYRKNLPSRGWRLESERGARQVAPATATLPERTLKGVRQVWTREADRRRLMLLALDFPQRRSSAQVVLSWSPGAPEAPREPGGR